MSSPKRSRRSRSISHSPPPKHKKSLDLVSTRRFSPGPHYVPRGRGRGRGYPRRFNMRRPYNNYGYNNNYRGQSDRYYPKYYNQQPRRYNSRDDSESYSRHRRSVTRSRSRDRDHSRSVSKERHRRSVSSSSSESSDDEEEERERARSKSQRRRHKELKSRARDSESPEPKPSKKKRNKRSSVTPKKERPVAGRSRSKDKTRYVKKTVSPPPARSKYTPPPTRSKRIEDDDDDDDDVIYIPEKTRKRRPDDDAKAPDHRRRLPSGSLSPEPRPRKKISKSALAQSKELIPRNRLHQIFTLISQDADFDLEEDISIAIQRNPYAEPSEDSTVTNVFDESLFAMVYPYEGRKHKPIFDREEIKVFGHDKNLADDPDFERRVIRVKPGKSTAAQGDASQSSSFRNQTSVEITRTVRRARSDSGSSRSRSRTPPRKHGSTKFRLRVSTDPRFESRYAEVEDSDDEASGSRRSHLDPSDLRHGLRKSVDPKRPRDRDSHDTRRRSPAGRDSSDTRIRKKDQEDLPDYSRRKDKYQYTPWLDQPELIPKDPKYFQHDDREHHYDRSRGRGRFFRSRPGMYRRPFRPFRPRGMFRGTYRGRGDYGNNNWDNNRGRGNSNYSNYHHREERRSRSPPPRRTYTSSSSRYGGDKSMEREWKHDKFSELERGDGEKKSPEEGDREKEKATHSTEEHPHSTSER